MKNKITACILIIIMVLSSVSALAETTDKSDKQKKNENSISAQSPHVILQDLKTGTVLYEKQSEQKVYPAGLTTIMTALIVIEKSNLEELVTANESALSNVASGDSKMGIVKEEKLSVRQLLYGMLLSSASDAANVLAENTSGSIEEFVNLMNSRAKELGMKNTNFTNPTGEHDERHYTTAKDMAVLTRTAMKNETFREIVKTQSYSIPATEKSRSARKITNRNHFVSYLLRNDYYYKYSTGIKTGYTVEAKSCIAASAEKNGIEVLALVFKAETENNIALSFDDCKNMFDYVFENYVSHPVVKNGEIIAQTKILHARRENKIILKSEKDVSVIVKKDVKQPKVTYKDSLKNNVEAPVQANDVIGEREYFLDGKSVGKVKLLSEKNYKLDVVTFIINKMVDFFTSPLFFVILAFILAGFVMAERQRRKILRKRRREARKKRNEELIRSMNVNK